jgi:hypothetical protein
MIHYITENWADIVGILAAAHVLALAIVNVTPSKKDDELYNKLYKLSNFLRVSLQKLLKSKVKL